MRKARSAVIVQPIEIVSLEERERFCAAPGLPVLSRALLEGQRPDASWQLADQRARCSLWWQATPVHAGQRVGLIGHFAAVDAAAGVALLNAACGRLADRGCTLAVGPMDGNTWQNYRLIVERGPEPTFFLEPDNDDDWPRYFEESGFHALAYYYSALNANLEKADPELPALSQQLAALGVYIRALRLDEATAELTRLYALSLKCFRESFLFTPIRQEDFLAQYQALRDHVRPELVLIAEQQGRTVGYNFAIPDLLQARRGQPIDTFIIKTLAVEPGLRGAGLGRLLVGRCHEAGRALGYTRAIHALMQDTSVARKISDRVARPMRRYALFARALGAGR